MEHSTLDELLDALEKKQNVHICVTFCENYTNAMLTRSVGHRSHTSAMCKFIRMRNGSYQPCSRCRRLVERMVIRSQKPVAGYCPYGVYEYCSPVIYHEKVVALVLVGNIFMNTPEQRNRLNKQSAEKLIRTMETGYSVEDCRRTAGIVGSYIKLLLDTYGITDAGQDPLVDKIRNYILDNFNFGFSSVDLAETFGYNEKYLGRLFKERSGQTIKEYCNTLRINEAKKLLLTTDLPISEIAGLAGFNNITHFNYVFGKHMAMSPTQYRETAATHLG